MSFSLSTSASREGIKDAVMEEAAKQISQAPVEHQPGVAHACIKAAELAEGWALQLGDEYVGVYVSVSGHANAGRQPSEAWADECLTVSLAARTSLD